MWFLCLQKKTGSLIPAVMELLELVLFRVNYIMQLRSGCHGWGGGGGGELRFTSFPLTVLALRGYYVGCK